MPARLTSIIRYVCAPVALCLLLTSCRTVSASRENPTANKPVPVVRETPRGIRATGTVRAVREQGIPVPRIQGIQGMTGRITLVRLASNGAEVQKDDVLAEFDRTQQLDTAREALTKYEDLQHQVEKQRGENRSETEKRAEEMAQAKAELAKAEIQLRIGPVLAEIERLKNEVKAEDAKTQVASLEKSHKSHEIADAAALRILELKTERQRLVLERATNNAEKLVLKAPLAGMVVLENTWRSGSMGPAQVGDQMWGGQPLLRILTPPRWRWSPRLLNPTKRNSSGRQSSDQPRRVPGTRL